MGADDGPGISFLYILSQDFHGSLRPCRPRLSFLSVCEHNIEVRKMPHAHRVLHSFAVGTMPPKTIHATTMALSTL